MVKISFSISDYNGPAPTPPQRPPSIDIDSSIAACCQQTAENERIWAKERDKRQAWQRVIQFAVVASATLIVVRASGFWEFVRSQIGQ